MKSKILKTLTAAFFLLASMDGFAQNHVLTGYVKDDRGTPLPGAFATIPQTQKSAVADADGKFLIEVNSPSDSLIISNTGYIDFRGLTGTQSTAAFELVYNEQKAKLDEVVVVGFGRQKKATLTGAVSSVSVKDIERSAVAQLSNAIGGKLPGIITRQSSGEPGADAAQVFIRGIATFAGTTAPLVFVDGIERPLNNINAMEIESFSILKDASATAVYGVRGANGVILINTKKGTVGKPKLVFRSEYASMQAQRLPNYINGAEYANLMNEARTNVGKTPEYTDAEVEKYATGSDPYLFPNVNWTDQVMKTNTWQTINNLNVSGGGEFVRYFTNVGYTEQNGIWRKPEDAQYNTNANFKRYNFRSNVDINVSKSFSVELGLGAIIQSQNYPGTSSDNILGALRKVTPINFPVNNPDGSLGAGSMVNANPWGLVGYSGYSRQDRNTVQGTFAAKWDLSKLITKGLDLSGRFGYDHYHLANKVRNKSFLMKRYYKDAKGKDQYQILREATPMGLSVGNNATKNVYYEAKLNYNRTFGDHGLSGLLLFNQNEFFDLTTTSPLLSISYRRRGYAARFTYDYQQRYLLEGNFGYNGSENFPPGQKYGFFPSVSAGWIVSKENFWGDDNPISSFKIRGSYGKVGNDGIGGERFLFLTTVNTTSAQSYRFGDDMINYPGIDELKIGNPNVTWEVAHKTNIGIDLEMLRGKILVQADIFNENRSSILIQRADIPFFSGIYPWTVPYGNLGKANNKGFDGMVEWKDLTPGGWQYSFRGTFTYAKNEIIEAAKPPSKYLYQQPNGTLIGQPYILKAIGLFQDQSDIDNSPRQTFQTVVRPGDIKFKDINGDGVIDANDRIYSGYARTPQIIYGFGGTVAYKNFDLSVFFQGAAKTNIFLQGASMYAFNEGFGVNNVVREYYDNRFIPGGNNVDAKYPLVIDIISENNYRWQNSLYMVDGSFLRLKNAELGYTVPKLITDRWKMSTIRIFANGLNLITWDKVKIIDPESDNGTGRYPLSRNLNFGFQLNF